MITPLHFYLSLCLSVPGVFQEIGEIREFQRTNCELSFQTKIRRNFDASVSLLLFPAKFRKLGDEPKRKFAASDRNFVAKLRKRFTKRSFVIEIFLADQGAVV